MAEKTSDINFKITLDENHLPTKIQWQAENNSQNGECGSVFLNMWDEEQRNALQIHLWTKTMRVDEMKMFFFQTMHTMADSLNRATGDEELVKEMKEFAQNFGEKIGALKRG